MHGGGDLVGKSCPTLGYPMDCSLPGCSVHGVFQARMGCHFLLQGIFPIQGSNLGLLHCGWILHQLCYQGSARYGEKGPNQSGDCALEAAAELLF